VNQQTIDQALSVKEKYETELLNKAHVVGVGVGVRTQDRIHGDEPCIVVMVDKLIPSWEIAPEHRIPSELDGVGVDIQPVGDLFAQRNRDYTF
jgi:UTP-glucose-1-phosphate uridylyltransferase